MNKIIPDLRRTRLIEPLLACLVVLPFGFEARADDDRPIVDAATVVQEKAAKADLPTFHLVGDSTVKSGGTRGMYGWGERIKPFFDESKINVVNHAMGGRSARTFTTEGRWARVEAQIKPGDTVIIQFGHNDQGRIGDPANKHRADGKGIGEETVPDTLADGTVEQVHTFGWYMGQMVKGAQAKGAKVIVCAPIPHKDRWANGRDFASLAEWDKQVADKLGAQFLDLTLVVTDAYKKIGKEKADTFFADKGTHTTDEGAQFNARCVVAGLKSLKENPVAGTFSESGKTIESYNPINDPSAKP